MSKGIKIGELTAEAILKIPIPPRPQLSPGEGIHSKIYINALHNYYEANKEQIIAESKVLGENATRKRWRIASATWPNLKHRWKMAINKPGRPAEKPETKRRGRKKIGDPPGGQESSELPPFPTWDPEWPNVVKVAWLNNYPQLAKVH